MSFPSSPLNNQVAVVNNITYKYVSSTNTWNRIATSNVGFYYVTATTLNANNEAYVGGISILPFAQAAFNAANTVSNTITVLQGVDNTQNTNITVIQGVDTAQNTRMSIIEGVDVTQNTNITAVNTYAASAFAAANTNATNVTVLQGVDATQNANITVIDTKAQAAFDKANNVTNTDILSPFLLMGA